MPSLATPEGQQALDPHLDGVALLVLDNLSSLCACGDENSSESWQSIQNWSLSLRRRGISVLFVHHAGKGGGQRGTSMREDNLNTVLKLDRPKGYSKEEGARVVISLEKTRGFYGDATQTFEAQLIQQSNGALEWVVKSKKEARLVEVATLTNEGNSQREIAETLGISAATVNRDIQKAREGGLINAA